MMFLSLYTILLVLVQVKVNGEEKESGILSVSECTYKKSGRQGERPCDTYLIKQIHNYNSVDQCMEACSANLMCRSVMYVTPGEFQGVCDLYNISLQELRDAEIESDLFVICYHRSYTTYDRKCDCPAGHEMSNRPAPVSCKPCADGFFKESAGPETCTECPNGVSNKDKTSCDCPAGQEISSSPDTVSCKPCADGFFKEFGGTDKCTKCLNGIASNKNKTFCDCLPGYEPTSDSLDGNVCKQCKENEVSAYGRDPCTQAGEGEVPNYDKSKFICNAGYERNQTVDKCQKCQTGYFKSDSGDVFPCLPCPCNTEATKRGATRCEEVIEVGVIICVVLGSVEVLAAAGLAVFLYCRKHRRRPKQSPDTSSEEGEAKGNDYSDDYSGESGSSNSQTVALSTS